MICRREFLQNSVIVVTGVGLAPSLLAGAAEPAPDGYTRRGFDALVGASFTVDDGEARGRIQLAQVVDGPVDPELDQFLLRFRGESGTASFEDGLYELVPDVGDPIALHLQLDGVDAEERPLFSASVSVFKPIRDPSVRCS